MAGVLQLVYEVTCATCDANDRFLCSKSSAVEALKISGWVRFSHLWRCPSCAARFREKYNLPAPAESS